MKGAATAVIVIKQPDVGGISSIEASRPDSLPGQGLWNTPPGQADLGLYESWFPAVADPMRGVDPADFRVWSSAPADPMHDADLLAALSDLENAVDEARDEGFPAPSEEARRNAERLLRDMYPLRRCRYEVYPTQDGEVAVSAPGGRGRSVLVLCESDGRVLCLVNLNGKHRRALYDPESAAILPDGFVREALAALDK